MVKGFEHYIRVSGIRTELEWAQWCKAVRAWYNGSIGKFAKAVVPLNQIFDLTPLNVDDCVLFFIVRHCKIRDL